MLKSFRSFLLLNVPLFQPPKHVSLSCFLLEIQKIFLSFVNNLLTTILQNDLLTEAFGSSKKKRAMASRLRNKIDNTGLDDTVTEVVQALANEPMDKAGLNFDVSD